MEESVDLHKEAGKENEQTLANLSTAEEATGKDEVEIEKGGGEIKKHSGAEIKKHSIQDWERFKRMDEIL